jgi:hypothetical protein
MPSQHAARMAKGLQGMLQIKEKNTCISRRYCNNCIDQYIYPNTQPSTLYVQVQQYKS